MRIIGGNFRGKKITAPNNLPVRPTTDFAKEALFNILNNSYNFDNIAVLDLFSGTGNLTYEFISRGCLSTVSVDENFNCVRFIKSTTELLKAPKAIAVKSDAFTFLEKCNQKFDVIVADPPYEMDNLIRVPNLVFTNNLLTEEGVLIIEHSTYTDLSNHPNFKERRKYGNVCFSFFAL